MVQGASAGLMQQDSQDLASWKFYSYMYCARGGKSWLYGSSFILVRTSTSPRDAFEFYEALHSSVQSKTNERSHSFLSLIGAWTLKMPVPTEDHAHSRGRVKD